jgi:hypothetical protein
MRGAVKKTQWAGSTMVEPATTNCILLEKRFGLAEAAPSVGQATAATPAAASTAGAPSPAASAAAASAAAAAAAATLGDFIAKLGLCGVFLVEDVERPQTDVGDFLLTEIDFVTRGGILGRHVCRRCGRCGRSAHERERHSGDSQHR